MPLHRDMTGDELHEPKGIETAADGTVYIADGSGSGTWEDRHSGIVSLNQYSLTEKLTDISAPSNHVYFRVPVKSELVSFSVVLDGAVATANNTLTLYINGVAFPDTLSVSFAGSTAGSSFNLVASTPSTLSAGAIIELRSDGASDNAVAAFAQVVLRAKV